MTSTLQNLVVPELVFTAVPRRMPNKRSRNDLFRYCRMSFKPPSDIALWPKKVGDIGNELMLARLEDGGQDAAGSSFSTEC